MPYELNVKRSAQRTLRLLADRSPKDYERIAPAIDALAENPRPRGCVKLRAPIWRIRVGPYRVIYAVFDIEQLVIILDVSRRTERTYEDLERLL